MGPAGKAFDDPICTKEAKTSIVPLKEATVRTRVLRYE
jgi:hypothetical protein